MTAVVLNDKRRVRTACVYCRDDGAGQKALILVFGSVYMVADV